MTKGKIAAITIGITAVLVVGAALIFGNRLFEKSDPKEAVALAVGKTYGEINQSANKMGDLTAVLMNDAYRQDVTLSIGKLSGGMFEIDPRILSAAQMLTLKNTTFRDTLNNRLTDTLWVQFAVTTLAEINVYCDLDIMAFKLPQAFDYYITVDPRHVATEWDASLLGSYLMKIDGLILEEPFYDYYRRLLFSKPNLPNDVSGSEGSGNEGAGKKESGFVAQIGILADAAEYAYDGKENLQEGESSKECEVYSIIIPVEALNAYWQASNPLNGLFEALPNDLIGEFVNSAVDEVNSTHFEDSLETQLYVYEGKVAGFRFKTKIATAGTGWDCDGQAFLTGEMANLDDVALDLRLANEQNAYHFTMTSEARVNNPELYLWAVHMDFQDKNGQTEPFALSWNIRWDQTVKSEDNFEAAFNIETGDTALLDLTTNGKLMADHTNKRIEADLKHVGITLELPQGAMAGSFSLQYLLRAEDAVNDSLLAAYEKDTHMPLTRVGELDVLAMYGRLMADQQLGSLLQSVMP